MSKTEFQAHLDKTLVRRHFDRHAAEYERYAAVQSVMAETLLRFADETGAPRRPSHILEIGCGTGRLTRMLLERYPEAALTALDLSPAMIAQTRDKIGADAERVRLYTADAEAFATAGAAGESFDLIVSGAAFQWFNDPAATVAAYLRKLAPGGKMAFSTFGPRTFHELHGSFRLAEAELGLPHTAHGQSFPSLGFWNGLAQRESVAFYSCAEQRVEHFAEVSEFLASVKKTGAGNASRDSGGGRHAGKKLFARMRDFYEQKYRDAEGIRATYDIYYGLYKRP